MKIKSFNSGKRLLVLAILLITFSCKKDSADFLITLPDPDPCANTVCLNGGHCVNGDCVCPEGYGGADCSQQITPRKIKVTKIEVTKFPATTGNGGGWDASSGADIFPELSKGDAVLWKSSTYYENAGPSSVYAFNITPAIDLTEPQDQYTIRLYDYDSGLFESDDFMGEIIFTPYSKANGFPPVITLDANAGVAFKLHLSYVW
ncbi:hypothetical protein [Agriterribacter sp.]|uniref:hypothetical protein n=1 Tax=Agriterribacter sp. TaxID=2821509 RepID=UPI002BD7228E|nr:hypothetical protein [Agriterribacter sp.]HRP57061.1 hypothetical protein [Agriterribacter sp.]